METSEHRYAKIVLISLLGGCLQVISGLFAGSLAVIGDAVHTLFHVVGHTTGFTAELMVKRSDLKDKKEKRVRALFGFINAVGLLGISIYIGLEGVKRFIDPPGVTGYLMIIGALIGLATNVISMRVLHRTHDSSTSPWSWRHMFDEDADETHQWVHRDIFFDCGHSVLVLFGAIIIVITSFYRIDAVLSVILACLIGISTIYNLWTKTVKNIF